MCALFFPESETIAANYPRFRAEVERIDTYLNQQAARPFYAWQASDKLRIELNEIEVILALFEKQGIVIKRRVWLCPVDGQEVEVVSDELLHCDLCDTDYEESACRATTLYSPRASTVVEITGMTKMANPSVFIGHGRSPLWREVKDFIQERLHLQYEEFNRESVAGIATSDRLSQMLENSAFALLLMTAEDEDADGKKHARLNVIHEAGLFQGRLGFTRAIILLEDGCEEFSNIHGLGQIRFPKGDVSAKFEEIRRVLEREGLLPKS